jgi:hypothetical protein
VLSGREEPRGRLHSPHTTSMSLSRSGFRALRSHALGRWSACRSSVLPQSLHHGLQPSGSAGQAIPLSVVSAVLGAAGEGGGLAAVEAGSQGH